MHFQNLLFFSGGTLVITKKRVLNSSSLNTSADIDLAQRWGKWGVFWSQINIFEFFLKSAQTFLKLRGIKKWAKVTVLDT